MKYFISLWLVLILVLSACGAATTESAETSPESEATPTEAATAIAAESDDSADEAANTNVDTDNPAPETEAETAPVAESSGSAECRPEPIEQAINLPFNADIANVTADDWVYGGESSDYTFTLIEYSDFQCPACQQAAPALEALKQAYGDEMRFVFRHNPLVSIHNNATAAAEAAESVGNLGGNDAFWVYHDLLFENQSAWSDLGPDELNTTLAGYAAEVGVSSDAVLADLENGTYSEQVAADIAFAQANQINSTPTIYIDGYPFPIREVPLSPEGIDLMRSIIGLLDQQYDQPEQVIDPTQEYEATIVTDKGEIVIDLFADTAPVNVNSFAFLAAEGWYNGTSFHRVLPDFMAQGGDPSGTGVGWPGYRCDDEVNSARNFSEAGVVALANSGPNTNGGQFFITYGPTPHLNEGFTIIGEVRSGQDVVNALTPRDPQQQPSFLGDSIVEITVSQK